MGPAEFRSNLKVLRTGTLALSRTKNERKRDAGGRDKVSPCLETSSEDEHISFRLFNTYMIPLNRLDTHTHTRTFHCAIREHVAIYCY